MEKIIKNEPLSSMTDHKPVSIGIPFYNAENYLFDAIQSVLNQTFTDFELLLINDGSNDKSLEIAMSFNDSRIQVLNDDCNRGLPYRLNQISRLAKGEYLARMDADDIMHPDRIKVQLDYLKRHPQTDVVGTDVCTIDTANQLIGIIKYEQYPKTINDVLRHRCFIHPTIMAKREWFINHPYDEKSVRMEDFNLWIRTIEYSNFANIGDVLLFYRTNGLPYLSRYLKSMKGERQEVRKIKNIVSHYHLWLIKNYCKCILYSIFSILHITDKLLSMRTKGLGTKREEQLQMYLMEAISDNRKETKR